MDWKAKVDLFEQLRREHEFGIGTIAGVAAKFGVVSLDVVPPRSKSIRTLNRG